MLALDGRIHNHITHANLKQLVASATGNLFWVVQRTSNRKEANLSVEYGTLRCNDMSVTLPSGVHNAKLTKNSLPSVPVLVNKRVISVNTRLMALDDSIITRAKDQDKQAKEKENKSKASSSLEQPAAVKKQRSS